MKLGSSLHLMGTGCDREPWSIGRALDFDPFQCAREFARRRQLSRNPTKHRQVRPLEQVVS
jgi:hypothetical protein